MESKQDMKNKAEELSDEELDGVSGGVGGFSTEPKQFQDVLDPLKQSQTAQRRVGGAVGGGVGGGTVVRPVQPGLSGGLKK